MPTELPQPPPRDEEQPAADGPSTPVAEALLNGRADATDASFRDLVDQLHEGVLVHREGRIEYANSAALAFLRYDALDELSNRALESIVHPDDRANVRARLHALSEGARRVPPARERLLRRDGTAISLEVSALRVEFRGSPAVVAVARDVSEREKLQAQLVLADRMASVGRLAAGVAHEINNPLTYVLLHLDAVERGLRPVLDGGPAPERELLVSLAQRVRQALDGADRVRRIVRDLRSFSRTDEELRGPVDLRRALDAAADMASHEVKHRARLVRDYDRLPTVFGSEGRLSQVFLNLLVNAAHAIPDGASPDEHEVRVSARVDDGHVLITVRDTGVGIAAEHLPRLFEPFFTTKHDGRGSGLGLSIVHTLLEQCGGELSVQSAPGQGSAFTVRLPCTSHGPVTGRVRFVNDEPASDRPGSYVPAAEPPRAVLQPRPRPRVLVIDDEPFVLRALRRALSEEFDVTALESAAEGQRRLEGGERFDAVLCDVVMPGFSGADLFEWLEAKHPALLSRVLFMSGGYPDSRSRALAERTPGRWLDKPFSEDEVRRRVSALVRGL